MLQYVFDKGLSRQTHKIKWDKCARNRVIQMYIWFHKGDENRWTDGQVATAMSKFHVTLGNSCPFQQCQDCSRRWTRKVMKGLADMQLTLGDWRGLDKTLKLWIRFLSMEARSCCPVAELGSKAQVKKQRELQGETFALVQMFTLSWSAIILASQSTRFSDRG